MKKIIDGVTYNTETATKIAEHAKLDDNDKHVILYQNRKGFFFYHIKNFERAEGHISEWYNDYSLPPSVAENKYTPKHFIEYCATTVYNNPFYIERKGKEVSILFRLPETLKDLIEFKARESQMSVNTYILRCVESCTHPQPALNSDG